MQYSCLSWSRNIWAVPIVASHANCVRDGCQATSEWISPLVSGPGCCGLGDGEVQPSVIHLIHPPSIRRGGGVRPEWSLYWAIFLTRTLDLVLVLNCVTTSQTYVIRHIYIIIELKGSRLQTDWLVDTQIFWSECFLHFKIKTLTTLESYFLQRFLKTFFWTYFSIFVGSIDWGWS